MVLISLRKPTIGSMKKSVKYCEKNHSTAMFEMM